MSADRWTPAFIVSRDWSFAALRRMAQDCTDPLEGEAILTVFWRKVAMDPLRHEKQVFPMLLASTRLFETRGQRMAEA